MPLNVNTVPWTLRLDDTRVTALTSVTSWTDISGNGKNMTGSGPTVGAGTPTGKASIAFDGVDDKFTSAYPMHNFVTDTNFTIFLVAKPTVFVSGVYYADACILRDNGNQIGIYSGQDGGNVIGAWNADTWPWPNPRTPASSQWYVITHRLRSSDGASQISLDGGATWATDYAGDPVSSLFGSLEFGAGYANFFTGEMSAAYIIDAAMSDADVGDVFAYLKDRFILAATVSVSIDNAKLAAVATLPSPTVVVEAEPTPIIALRTVLPHAYLPPMTLRRAE